MKLFAPVDTLIISVDVNQDTFGLKNLNPLSIFDSHFTRVTDELKIKITD